MAEIQYSQRGYFNIGTIHRLSDGSIIKIPYRMVKYDLIFGDNDFNVVANTALEFRLKDIDNIHESDFSFDLREFYFEIITSLGDFSIGKQIITWGSASANNPTDNISPYNYYYLFSLGNEKKEGVMAFNSIIYWNDIKFNAVFLPQLNTNVLPLNDPEFSISTPIVPKDEQILELNNPYEYGISINIPFNSMDITTSYFSGYDRIVSFFGANVWSNQAFLDPIIPDTVLSYRKTNVCGLGYSTLFGDFTVRADLGYFNTQDNIKDTLDIIRDYKSGKQIIIEACDDVNEELPSWANPVNCENEPELKETLKLDNSAQYYQYTIEIEYMPISDFNIIGQYSKHKAFSFGRADSLTLSDPILLYPEKLFIPGIGSPNTFITSNALSISAQKLFTDNGLELRYTSMFDLDKKGSLHEVGIEYEIYENTKLLIAVNKIFDDNKNIETNPFTGMEDFSHIRFEIKYYY